MVGPLAARVISLSSTGVARVSADGVESLQPLVALEAPPPDETDYGNLGDKLESAKPFAAGLEVPPAGKLIVEEEVALGHVSLSACMSPQTLHFANTRR